ncbi:MAG: nitroreductase family protein, partial [Terrimicrobiaceae bacterium]
GSSSGDPSRPLNFGQSSRDPRSWGGLFVGGTRDRGRDLVLAATELGLSTYWIGGIKPKVVAEIVGWGKSVQAVAIITVGTARKTGTVQFPSSRRKPLEELVRWL